MAWDDEVDFGVGLEIWLRREFWLSFHAHFLSSRVFPVREYCSMLLSFSGR